MSKSQTLKKILIVEDDYLISNLMEFYVSQCDSCELIGIADNSDDAFEIAKREKPDCVLMDVRINGEKDGIDTAILINQLGDIPIIYTSGNTDDKTSKRASKTNMLAFLAKPINKDDLFKLLID